MKQGSEKQVIILARAGHTVRDSTNVGKLNVGTAFGNGSVSTSRSAYKTGQDALKLS